MTRGRWAAITAIAVAVAALVGVAIVLRHPAAEQPGGPPIATTTPVIASATFTAETAPPAATASAEDEVSAAYLAYWTAYTRAVRQLDDRGLEAAMSGPMLERRRAEVADLRQQGHAVVIAVEHHFVVARLDAEAGTATVVDEYTNRSYLVSADTGAPITGQPTPNTLSDTYYLAREGTQWKVNDGVRTVTFIGEQPPSP